MVRGWGGYFKLEISSLKFSDPRSCCGADTSEAQVDGKPVIAVAGLGAMGLGIAQVFAAAGHPVVATDANPAARDSAALRMAAAMEPRVAAGKMTGAERDAVVSRLTVVDGVSGFAPAALVIEAVAEDLAVKRALLSEIAEHVTQDAVIATNTSSLSMASVMDGLVNPARGLGLHFFNPAPAMRLVELVVPKGADPAAVARARSLTEAAGKTVIACADTPGFIVNRCARPFYGEALAMLEEGRTASDIDASLRVAGYRIGPLALIDLIGADVHLAATRGVHEAMGGHPRYHVFDVLVRQVAAGRLGRKSGAGFLFPGEPGQAPADAGVIVARIEATMANEAASLLAGGAVDEGGIDMAMTLGMNLPKGPFAAARARGLDAVRAELARLATAVPAHLKGRYDAVPALEALR
jgi:3-hydroxybutyryl-CoA dehydrogenase